MHAPRMFATAALIAALTLVACAPGAPTPTPSESAATPSPTPSQSGSASPSGGVTEPGAPGTTRAITVDRPGTGDTVDVPFTVSGTADVFEAALTIDAIDESGLTACVRHLTATSGSGTRGTWEGSLAFPPEEDPLRLTLRAYTFSPKDGSMAELVEFPITASPERPDIILTNPRCGDVYRPGGLMLLTGTAAVFEASFSVDVRDSRRTVLTVPVTADECCVESQFSSRLTLPPDLSAGFYDIAAYSISAKDGSNENEFAVQIEVR